ncbi:hypothetical protein QMK54_28770 [Pseudomonas sp. P5_109]|uniref:hypothetical protein n=1 Tax=Pseudomonas sp. P5_109 TaxID=3043441 RepID=UPI0039B768C5|nr:hypothetical protein QMK54_28770 [Pseudomonas sp. P5_109]
MKVPLYLRILLLLTLCGCGWLFWQDQAGSPNTPTSPAAVSEVSTPTPPEPTQTAVAETGPLVDVFPIQTWKPPPPPPVVSNPTPTPPPLPFVVSAQWRYQNQAKIVVLRGNGNQYTLCNRCTVPGRIRPGGMLDKDYRLDKLTDTSVVLTYLPMKHVSTLHLGTQP